MRAVMGWSPEKRRQAALAFLAAAVVIGVAAIGAPLWLAHRHYDNALEDMDARLVRYERLAAARPALGEVRPSRSVRCFLHADDEARDG